MNTAQCKAFIETILSDPKNKILKEELTIYHEASNHQAKYWSRTSKSKLKNSNDHWLVNKFQDLAEYPVENIWYDPSYSHMNFDGCIIRNFIHKQTDACFVIVTDSTDTNVVGWMFMVD